MRIVFFSSVYPGPTAPTVGIFNRSRVQALRAAGDEVQVVVPDQWPRTLPLPRRRTATISDDSGGGPPPLYPTYFYPPKLLQSYHGWFMWQSVRRCAISVLTTFRPDAILSYWAHPDGEAALRVARHGGVPIGLIVGGSDILVLTRNPSRRRVITRVLKSVDAVFPVGSDLAKEVVELGVPPTRVHELQQGVDSDRFSPGDPQGARRELGVEPGVPLLLFVGHLVPVKGLEVLLEAASRLAARGTDFRLWLVGDGPQRRSLEKRATTLGLASRLRFLGARPHEQLPDFFRAADLTVLSSYSEGIPNVLRESLACGTPFVATRVGGIADIATPECRLVLPGDPLALAEAIADRLGQRLAKRAVAPYSWGDSAERVRTVLASLVQANKTRP
jgi:glycosyltransferase involved in cell wall biosynthesis